MACEWCRRSRGQEHNFTNFKEYVNRYFLETSLDAAKVASAFTPIVDVLGAIATALVVYIGGTAVLGKSIDAGCVDRVRVVH